MGKLTASELKKKQQLEEKGITLQLLRDVYVDTPFIHKLYEKPDLYDFTFGRIGNNELLLIGVMIVNKNDSSDVKLLKKSMKPVSKHIFMSIDELGEFGKAFAEEELKKESAQYEVEFYLFWKCKENELAKRLPLFEEVCMLRGRYLFISPLKRNISFMVKKAYNEYLDTCTAIPAYLKEETSQERYNAVRPDINRLKNKFIK